MLFSNGTIRSNIYCFLGFSSIKVNWGEVWESGKKVVTLQAIYEIFHLVWLRRGELPWVADTA
jgi:hypothetical protein